MARPCARTWHIAADFRQCNKFVSNAGVYGHGHVASRSLPRSHQGRLRPASVMMPFDPRFRPVHELCEELGRRCIRADDIWENDVVMQDVVSLIDRSRVVIADCTGRNPNVFYEIGIAPLTALFLILTHLGACAAHPPAPSGPPHCSRTARNASDAGRRARHPLPV